MSFFTILFFLLCLRFTTYTYKHEHAHKSPHFPPNTCNLFFDISHFESFHLFPSSTLCLATSLALHKLVYQTSSAIILSSFAFSFRQSWNSHPLLLAGDVELNPGPSPLNFTPLNIRSIRSFQKSSSLHDYLADHPTEILSLNETWLQPTDSDNFVSSLAPPGYSILHSPRLTGQGVGLALIFRSFLKFKLFRSSNLPPPESFELMATKLSTGNKETIFLNIYRPPSSKMSTFLDEFQNLLEIFVPSPSELIIIGDFNIHADSDLTTPNKFSGILDNFHLTQHINFPTHDDGHTLDLLITRSSSTVITHLSHHESYQSDHKSFIFKFFPHIRPTTQRSTIQYRSYNTIDVDNFKSDILTSLSTQTQPLMPPTLQINFPPPSNPFSTSMPQSNPKLLSKDPTHHGLTPKFSKPSENVVDLSDVGVAGSLPLIA